MERPIPYKGNDNFIFVSYAHRDAARVWPVIQGLIDRGYRVWYDEGIDPGTEWDENIAAHVSDCGCFLAVMTENYLASDNCKDELKFSRDLEKPQLLLYLEDVQLSSGMAMRIGRNPKIYAYQLDGPDALLATLCQEKVLQPFHKNAVPKRKKGKKKLRWWYLAVPLVVVVIGAALLWSKPSAPAIPETTPPTETPTEAPTEAPAETLRTQTLLFTPQNVEASDKTFVLGGQAFNDTDQDLKLTAGRSYINGAVCTARLEESIPAGEEKTCILSWDLAELARYGIQSTDIISVEAELIYEAEGKDPVVLPVVYYPQGEEMVAASDYELQDGQIPIAQTEYLYAIACKDRYDETDGTWYQPLLLQNRSDRDITVTVCIDNIGGTAIHRFPTYEIPAGKILWAEPGYTVSERMVPWVDFCGGYLQVSHQGELLEETEPFALFFYE